MGYGSALSPVRRGAAGACSLAALVAEVALVVSVAEGSGATELDVLQVAPDDVVVGAVAGPIPVLETGGHASTNLDQA